MVKIIQLLGYKQWKCRSLILWKNTRYEFKFTRTKFRPEFKKCSLYFGKYILELGKYTYED